jgi:hypothetical protein
VDRVKNSRQSQATVREGLHILARIIARETLKADSREMDGQNISPTSLDTLSDRFSVLDSPGILTDGTEALPLPQREDGCNEVFSLGHSC